MHHQRRPSGSAHIALATSALCLACSGSEPSAPGATGGSPTDSGTASGTLATTGTVGTTGDAADSGAMGTSAVTNTTGAPSTTGMTSTTGTTSATGTTGDSSTTAGAGGTGGAGSATSTGDAVTTGDSTTGAGTGDSAPSAGCGSPAGLMSGRTSIDVGGTMREYILLIPDDYDPNQPYRLIFGWHPWGGSAEQTENMGYFGLESVIDGQAILVAPEGQDFGDNGLGWGNENGEDIDFLHAMLDRFGSELCIDQNRIFSTGFSFGAMFSFTLACAQDGMMRAIAPQAGNATTSGPCEDGTRPVATLAFIGVDDSLLNGHRQAVDIFAERNGCASEAVTLETSWCDGLSSMYEPCICVEYPDCNEGYPVIECEYQAGHVFAPSSGATIWNFFSQF